MAVCCVLGNVSEILPGEVTGSSSSNAFLGIDIEECGWARSRDLGVAQEGGKHGVLLGSP